MKKFKVNIKKITAVLTAVFCLCTSVYAAKIPASEYEELSATQVAPWLRSYHQVTTEQLANNVKGGEGYQCDYSAAISNIDANIQLRGYDTSGIYRSEDGGKNWKPAESGDPAGTMRLAFYPESKDVCFALGMGSEYAGGVFKSTDGGKNWTKVFAISLKYIIQQCDIVFGAKDEETGIYPMYIGISIPYDGEKSLGDKNKAGVFKSVDMGETFENIGFENYQLHNLWADPDGDTVVVALGQESGEGGLTNVKGGLYISEDGGKNWALSNKGVEDVVIRSIVQHPVKKNRWILATLDWETDDTKEPYLYESLDGCKTWNRIHGVKWQRDDQEKYKISTHRNPDIPHLYYTYPEADDPQGDKCALIADMNYTIYPERISYDNGRSFEVTNKDVTNNSEKGSTGWFCSSVGLTKADPKLINFGIYQSRDGGHNFYWSSSGISGALASDFTFDSDGELRFISMVDMGIALRDYNYEGDCPPMTLNEDYPSYNGRTAYRTIVDPSDPNHCFSLTGEVAYAKDSALVETFDGFKTFLVHTDMTKRLQQMTLEKASICLVRGLWYGAPRNKDKKSQVVYSSWFVSSNNGKTWRESAMEIMAVSQFDEDVAYSINSKNELYMTRDRAKTWENTGIEFPDRIDVTDIAPDVAEDYVLWVSRNSQVTSQIFRVDLKSGVVKTMGPENGLVMDPPNRFGMEMHGIAQCPSNPNILVCTGRDFKCARYAGFITKDGGEHWSVIRGLPENSGGRCWVFSPTKPLVYKGSMQGVYVLDVEKYFEYNGEENGK